MRTPRLFLGVFALALILPLLLACGGSDEPSSERSTAPESRASSGQTTAEPTTASAEPSPTPAATAAPTSVATAAPEGSASSGQTTAEPTTASAEPSPTPAATAAPTSVATAAPPMVQTSSETDREALVALYNATGRPNWNNNNNWLRDMPISEWEGVSTDDNDRVTELLLWNNELSGEIPPELGNLANLTGLLLIENQLRGEIPPVDVGDHQGVPRSSYPPVAGKPV